MPMVGTPRYIHPDATLLAFETAASFMGITAAVLAYLRKKAGGFTDSQLVAVIVLMACEFYPTTLYLLSEVYEGMPHVFGPINLVVKFIYGNILWIVVRWIVFLWARRVLLSRR
jgi:hypothetical protein